MDIKIGNLFVRFKSVSMLNRTDVEVALEGKHFKKVGSISIFTEELTIDLGYEEIEPVIQKALSIREQQQNEAELARKAKRAIECSEWVNAARGAYIVKPNNTVDSGIEKVGCDMWGLK